MADCRTNRSLKLIAVLMIFLSINKPALASCNNWQKLVPGHGNVLIYSGTVGDKSARAIFSINVSTGEMSGEIGFNDDADSLVMNGRMSKDLQDTELIAKNENDEVIANVHLVYSRWRQTWESAKFFASAPKDTCEFVLGKWTIRSPNKAYDIKLQMNGTMSGEVSAQRKANEKAAVLLRKALLNNDRKSVAKLFEYPFHSEYGNQLSRTWSSPENVITHYKEIIWLSNREIYESVPHVLQTEGDESIFLGGHVQLKDGYVSKICQEACIP